MSVDPLTLAANHYMTAGGGVVVIITELVAPLEGTLVVVEQLTGTLRCLDE